MIFIRLVEYTSALLIYYPPKHLVTSLRKHPAVYPAAGCFLFAEYWDTGDASDRPAFSKAGRSEASPVSPPKEDSPWLNYCLICLMFSEHL